MVANVELTLMSIVQGVALYFLTDSARASIAELRLSSLPYVVSGAALILVGRFYHSITERILAARAEWDA